MSEHIASILLRKIPYLEVKGIYKRVEDTGEGAPYTYNARSVPSGKVFPIWGERHAPNDIFFWGNMCCGELGQDTSITI